MKYTDLRIIALITTLALIMMFLPFVIVEGFSILGIIMMCCIAVEAKIFWSIASAKKIQ